MQGYPQVAEIEKVLSDLKVFKVIKDFNEKRRTRERSVFFSVEVAGVEPASKQGIRKVSTRLVVFNPSIRARQTTAEPESQPLDFAR